MAKDKKYVKRDPNDPSNWSWDEPTELSGAKKVLDSPTASTAAKSTAASALTQKGWADEGKKLDDGKLPYDLVPGEALEEIVKVLQFGARKYDAHNWCKGMHWSRAWSAVMRHLWAWWRGQDNDPETGLSHLAHAGCGIFFLIWFELHKVGTDDRFRRK